MPRSVPSGLPVNRPESLSAALSWGEPSYLELLFGVGRPDSLHKSLRVWCGICLLLVWTLAWGYRTSFGQASATPPDEGRATTNPGTPKIGFDVISVKPNESGGAHSSMGMTADGFTMTNVELVHVLLGQSFRIFDKELIGAPKWASSDRWDIEGKVSAQDVAAFNKMTFDQRIQMIQQILEERFALKVHHETRVLPVYALTVARTGAKMVASKDQATSIEGSPGVLTAREGSETGRGTTMRFLAADLSDSLGRRVVDQTGLTGRYDFTLTWIPDNSAQAINGSSGSGEAPGPSLFTAFEEQLGLRLLPVKASVDVVVIDHIEKPSEN